MALPSMMGTSAPVELDQAVVHVHGVERCEDVLGGVHFRIALAQGGATCGAHHQVGVGIDHGLTFQVGPLEFVAVAFGCRAG
jgi:hypothetical protein